MIEAPLPDRNGTMMKKDRERPQARAGKYLTFMLGDEHYGLEIIRVREIIGMMDITHVPQTPPFLKGLINLRGKVIPVIDLRLKFGLDQTVYTERTAIIVVEIELDRAPARMGVIVDKVSEVIYLTADAIEETPGFGAGLRTNYILGLAKAKDRVIILLDIGEALTDEELTLTGGA